MKRLHGFRGAATSPELADEKARLRRVMRAGRAALFAERPEAGARLVEACAQTLIARMAEIGVVGGYVPIGDEIDPRPLSARLASAGWCEALPRADDRGAPLRFFETGGELEPDAFGVPAPRQGTRELGPTLLLVPLLAFDDEGGRLGQGAGCYDRTIAHLRNSRSITVAGVAFAGQRVERLPCEAHDQRLDLILTDQGVVDVVKPRP